MRRPTLSSAARALRDRPRAAAALALLLTVGIAGFAVLATSPSAPAAPTFSYARTWTMVELQGSVAAGEVIAVTTSPDRAPAGTADGSLVARTRSGDLVQIQLDVTPGAASAALHALGYGDLLTQEAWRAAGEAVRPAAPGLMGTILNWLILLVFAAGAVALAMRATGRSLPGAGSLPGLRSLPGFGSRRQTDFATIMPTALADSPSPAATADDAKRGRKLPHQRELVRLAEVAGCDEAKLELAETIEFLQTPERFHELGARVPRGVLLFGPPGTGKTMLAKAVATEAGVPFYYTSGSEFVEKYVGVGARRIRDLFAQARKAGKGVIFFDEFDALGKARGGNSSHEEREQTLNQLLVELDGFSTTDDIVVMAATNRLDILDSALLRPGRFSRKIHVGLPDVVGRREILAVHARNKPIGEDVDLDQLARKSYGFSGAQLADLLNEAAIMAARRGGDTIISDDLHGGWLKVAVGTSRRRSMSDRERAIIAAHEVGHAVAGKLHGDTRRVEEISLFAHGEALGVTVSSQEDNDLPAESDLRARLVALMGGRAAEELLFQEVTPGASNDFEKANSIATLMVTKWGMGRDPEMKEAGISGRGSLSFLVASGGSVRSEIQGPTTRAIAHILDEAYAEARRTLLAHLETVRRIAAYLVDAERIDGDTFDALFDGTLEVPDAEVEWRPAASRPREWADIAATRGTGAAIAAASGTGETLDRP